jgi:hypothetical protein
MLFVIFNVLIDFLFFFNIQLLLGFHSNSSIMYVAIRFMLRELLMLQFFYIKRFGCKFQLLLNLALISQFLLRTNFQPAQLCTKYNKIAVLCQLPSLACN